MKDGRSKGLERGCPFLPQTFHMMYVLGTRLLGEDMTEDEVPVPCHLGNPGVRAESEV